MAQTGWKNPKLDAHSEPLEGPTQITGQAKLVRGRGAVANPDGRFERYITETLDDGWEQEAAPATIATEVMLEKPKSIISYNTSPDISFDRSINPYRGCEHGCVYCFARPSHAYLGLSPGLDFETRLFAKTGAAETLRKELGAKGYTPAPIALGANTDAYQPVERQLRITREILQVLAETGHPVGIITKSSLVLRDLDILQPMAEKGLVKVAISLTSLDHRLSRAMEPRASAPARRLATIAALAEAGIPVSVMTAPLIPALNDHELESLLEAASEAGAWSAGYVLLRLPHELKDLMRRWLDTHFPDKADHVFSLISQSRGGRAYDAQFGTRMRGTGPYADALKARFDLACRRLGLSSARIALNLEHFNKPNSSSQLSLL